MSDLRELYQQTIIDHNRKPRNFHALADANHHAKGHNPLCGDRLELYLKMDGDRIADASFTGAGCAISTASASMMTEAIKGRTIQEAKSLFNKFHTLLTTPMHEPIEIDGLDKLEVFSGVREFPVRIKCATLAWHTLDAALKDDRSEAKTE
jgi:nitrogen fixation NifU-like protein